jgi:hypothetical protein
MEGWELGVFELLLGLWSFWVSGCVGVVVFEFES